MKDDVTKAVLVTALHRIGRPATATEICDAAMQLMQNDGWPHRCWSELRPKSVSRHLQVMASSSDRVRCDSTTKENGREVPLYGIPNGIYTRTQPLPDAPDPEGEDHPLHGKTKRQQFVVFDAQDALLHALLRQRTEHQEQHERTNAMLTRHARELEEIVARNRRELLAVGLEVS